MSLVLALVLCAAPADPASSASGLPSRGDEIRARAWKVTVAGAAIAVAGAGFLVAGRVLEGMAGADASLANPARAFTVGGVMLACSGALVALLSVPMWTWRDEVRAIEVAVSPLGARLRW